jgi:hypothetical protein
MSVPQAPGGNQWTLRLEIHNLSIRTEAFPQNLLKSGKTKRKTASSLENYGQNVNHNFNTDITS